MNKKLQIHVLENIRDHGGWSWTGDLLIYENQGAGLRFEQSGYSAAEYATAGIMLVASGKVVAQDMNSRLKSPLCLTVDGLAYLEDLKHPNWRWIQRNWFAVIIASATIALSAAAIIVNALVRLNG